MIVKKYTAQTEKEAILKAKEDLGPEAVVLNTKTLKQRGFARMFKKDFVEITAALEEKEFIQAVKEKQPSFDVQIPKSTAETAVIEEKLDSLHNLLKNTISKDETADKEKEPAPEKAASNEDTVNFKFLKLIYGKLIDSEVDEKYANEIIDDINSSLKKESNIDSILSAVYQKIILKLGEPVEIQTGDKPKVVFFIGPTGVGKTTTIAKLASSFKLNNEKKVALITSDTYRIAAVEQLNTYANILDVPIDVVYTGEELLECIKKQNDKDLILVDTAGRSHRNEEQKNELLDMINTVLNSGEDIETEIYLVMSITTKYKDLISICNAYKEIDNFSLLFTKLDETTTMGNILNIRLMTGRPLSYTTSGQNVPDDIEKVDVQKLSKHLLGGGAQ